MARDVQETPYPRALAQRFREYLGQLRRVYERLHVSRLAQELGYEDSRFLDRLCEGQDYFVWSEIDDFCSRSGVDADWFKHGEGEPFAPSDACLSNVTSLLNELNPNDDWRLYLVRSDCRWGEVCFVRRDNDFVWKVYDTSLHLSAEVGAGGAHNLLRLYLLLKEINARWFERTVSHTLPKPAFETLVSGNVFPGAVFQRRWQCYWADDFPLLDTGDGYIANPAPHGPEFLAAQEIVRAQLASNRDDASGQSAIPSKEATPQETDTCPVCAYRKRSITRAVEDHGNRLVMDCPRCGPFRIGMGAVRRVEAGDVSPTKLSAWIRAHKESRSAPPTILQGQVADIVRSLPEHGVADKQRLLLEAIGRRTSSSESTDLVIEDDYGIAWAESGGELRYLLRALAERGMLQATETRGIASCEITPTGWQELEGAAERRRGGRVFVAMSFDPDMELAWSDGIAPALKSVGYEPYRVDKDQHLGRIDAKIHDEIDRSVFLVADMTGQRQGVYFEAGYAMGQGMPVVWCVHEDEVGELHFDTRQFNHVVWRDPEDLKQKLADRVAGAIKSG